MELFSALLVVNQNLSLEELSGFLARKQFNKVFILSSHKLFDWEIAQIEKGSDSSFTFKTTVDYLNESDMDFCDQFAEKSALEKCKSNDQKARFFDFFRDELLYQKNKIVHAKLLESYDFTSSWYCPGLGISERYWSGLASRLVNENEVHQSSGSFLASFFALVKRFRPSKNIFSTYYIVQNGSEALLIFDSVKRVKFSPEVSIKEGKFKYRQEPEHWAREVLGILHKYRSSTPEVTWMLATSIHEYNFRYLCQLKEEEVYILPDGYVPSNFPRSNFNGYFKGTFVTHDQMDKEMFEKNQLPYVSMNGFLESGQMSVPDSELSSPLTISLMLNHSGDWTALISRSDTDKLVALFVEISKHYRETDHTFIIRCHPNMNKPEHEGVRSIARIHECVKKSGLENLTVSDVTLEQDLERVDICLSEYSHTLVSAMQRGKLGVIVHLPHRRSFMQDYIDSGFHCVGTFDELVSIIDKSSSSFSSRELLVQQQIAVQNFNQAYQKYLNSC